jgi:hypothetical protein
MGISSTKSSSRSKPSQVNSHSIGCKSVSGAGCNSSSTKASCDAKDNISVSESEEEMEDDEEEDEDEDDDEDEEFPVDMEESEAASKKARQEEELHSVHIQVISYISCLIPRGGKLSMGVPKKNPHFLLVPDLLIST